MSDHTTHAGTLPDGRPSIEDVLKRAADRIERDGWAQHVMFREESCCAMGAISRETDGVDTTLFWDVVDVVRPLTPEHSLVSFNDDTGRTADDVTTLLRKAAEAAR